MALGGECVSRRAVAGGRERRARGARSGTDPVPRRQRNAGAARRWDGGDPGRESSTEPIAARAGGALCQDFSHLTRRGHSAPRHLGVCLDVSASYSRMRPRSSPPQRAPGPGYASLVSTHGSMRAVVPLQHGRCTMSRLTIAVGSLVSVLCVAPIASPTAQIRPHFGVGGGVTLPTGDYHGDSLGVGFNNGWQAVALVDFAFPRSPIGIRVDGTYGVNNTNNNGTFPTHVQTKLLGGSVDLTYVFQASTPVRPYVLTGVGLYHVRASTTGGGTGPDTSATKLSWNAGGGVRYGVRGSSLFLEARYSSMGHFLNGYATEGSFQPSVRVRQVGVTAGVRLGGE